MTTRSALRQTGGTLVAATPSAGMPKPAGSLQTPGYVDSALDRVLSGRGAMVKPAGFRVSVCHIPGRGRGVIARAHCPYGAVVAYVYGRVVAADPGPSPTGVYTGECTELRSSDARRFGGLRYFAVELDRLAGVGALINSPAGAGQPNCAFAELRQDTDGAWAFAVRVCTRRGVAPGTELLVSYGTAYDSALAGLNAARVEAASRVVLPLNERRWAGDRRDKLGRFRRRRH